MQGQTLRVVSWNVAQRRFERQERQAEALTHRNPDLVALQEVTPSTVEPWRESLAKIGLNNSVHKLAPVGTARTGPRRYGEMIASRWGLRALSVGNLGKGWAERLLSAAADTPWGQIEIHTAYIPHGQRSNDLAKVYTLEGLYKHLAHASAKARILCGDFNTPQQEIGNEIITWGQNPDGSVWGKYRGITGERWDRAERNILEHLGEKYDLVDVYRLLHREKSVDFSWYTRTGVGRRFDHIFASRFLNPQKCYYLHDFRKMRLSDHSAIEALFNPKRTR